LFKIADTFDLIIHFNTTRDPCLIKAIFLGLRILSSFFVKWIFELQNNYFVWITISLFGAVYGGDIQVV